MWDMFLVPVVAVVVLIATVFLVLMRQRGHVDAALHQLLDHQFDAALLLTPRWEATTLVDFACPHANVRAQQLLGTSARFGSLATVVPPAALAKLLKAAQRALLVGPVTEQITLEEDAQEAGWFLCRLLPHSGGELILIAHDITTRKRAQAQLELMVHDVPNPILLVAPNGTIAAANDQVERLFGYAKDELLGHPLEKLVPERLRRRHAGMRESFFEAPRTRPMGLGADLYGQTRDGREIPVEIGLNAIQVEGSTWVLAAIVDISARKQAQQALAEAHALTSAIIHSAPFSIIATDSKGIIIAMSPAAERMLWYSQAELVGRQTPELLHDRDEVLQRAQELSVELGERVNPGFDVFTAKPRRGITDEREWTYIRKDGSRLPVQLTVTPLRNIDNELTGYLGIAYDISERKRADDYIRFLAHHDVLTALPNRTLLQDRLNMAIERARRYRQRLGLLMVDLDNFKRINDSLGHHTGDELLVQVAQRLSSSVRSTDTVARMGGDEFVVVLTDVENSDQVVATANTILETLAQPVTIGTHHLQVTPSVGISIYPDDGEDAGVLLKNADTAMYEAKAAGRRRVELFAPTMGRFVTDRLELEHALGRALELGQLSLHFQPQIVLASGRPLGVEALLRWAHPERGNVAPGRFIPLAEETDMIVRIGDWVLQRACKQARELQQSLGQPLAVAVNMSPRQLMQKNVVDRIESILTESGLAPECLELELTENLLVSHTEEMQSLLHRIRALGVRIAIDDFGTGFSSLSYIARFPIDRIKIDQSFVRNLTSEASSAAVVTAIIAMAKGLGIEVIAEGVETVDQRKALEQRGCFGGQGFLFSRPRPAAEVAQWLDKQAKEPNFDYMI